jgi:methionyl-tRNA formyltransferase
VSAGPRIVVFSGQLTHSVRQGIAEIDGALPGVSWLVLLHQPRKRPQVLLRNQWRNLRRNGWRWIPYQAKDVMQRLAERAGAQVPAPGGPGAELRLQALQRQPNLRLLRVADIHAPEVLAQVQAFAPDLGLSLAAPILRRPLFGLPRLGTINLHKGKLPEFRGMPPAFWELWHDQREVGCSVHWVDERLDTGDLIAQARVERGRYATVRGLQLRLDQVGADLMRETVVDVLAGRAQAQPQPKGQGATHRKPTLGQVAQLEQRLERAVPGGSALKRAAKEVYGAITDQAGRIALRTLLAPRITVLLYHRVSDDVRDNLTVGVEQFDRQMALISQRCEVLSLDQVLATRQVQRSARPQVAVSFDDGYLDNYLHAAPILRRHGVPAAFFVSTGIVGTDGRFPHDVRRGNPPIPTMRWDQLRRMRDWGFHIGSHTVNHIDCAAEPEQVVRDELRQSREDLARELGLQRTVLAYPYGGRQHMTAARLELVKQAGYAGCLSAYGGTNIGAVDPFNVVRRGIHWEFSDRSFLVECLGLT